MFTIQRFNGASSVANLNSIHLVLLVILLYNVIAGEACMPGYEAERVKLREYLGIEWIPDGLASMKEMKMKPVRYANELNCNFQQPELCRWSNTPELDTLDFHLFKKEDNTDFPVIQVRPGPSKVALGEKMIFVGDRKREEQSAVLTSWPIRCQNSTGILTFTFWIYNGANVEVVLLEEDPKTHELRILHEKQHLDCGTITVNTECTVEIPPRETPFRIGIRAFDIKNRDGSFIMIDNILYDAQFCKVSDFGPDFQTEELMTAKEGELVQASSQLICHDFDSHCRWRNEAQNKQTVWRRGLTSPPSHVLFNETGTYTTPIAPFAFMYIEEEMPFPENLTTSSSSAAAIREIAEDAKKKGQRLLVSDPIFCQTSSTPAIISFRVWATKGVQMSICAMDLKMNDLECQKISFTRSPASVYHQFSVTQKFVYAFRVDYVNPDFDNFIIIDDIEYQATMCSEALNALDLGADFYTTPLLSTFLHRYIHSANDLACDFVRRGLNCRWANFDDDTIADETSMRNTKDDTGSTFYMRHPQIADTKWEIGLGEIDEAKFASLTNQPYTPESDLAIARLQWKNATAMLVSEAIRCLNNETSVLSLRYWRTGGTALFACIINSFTFDAIDCQRVSLVTSGSTSPESDRIFVDIPRYNEPIRIALRAKAIGSVGVVAIDDISFEGRICSSTAHTENNRIGFNGVTLRNGKQITEKRIAGPFTRGAKSSFTYGKAAQFGTQNLGVTGLQNLRGLNSYSNDIGSGTASDDENAHTAPDENVCRLLSCNFDASHMCLYTSTLIASSFGMFNVLNRSAHAMLFDRGRVAILESTKFSLNAPARLHFDFQIQQGIAHIHVCQDSVRRELDSCYAVDSTKTAIGRSGLVIHDFIQLLPTDTKVYIIAKLDARSRKANVWIDNIELTDVENHRIC